MDELSESQGDYLEAISHIIEKKQVARVKDIARHLNVNNSSVTGALKLLADKGLINYSPYEVITLTEKGKKSAHNIITRHRTLKEFFTEVLSIEEHLADDTACKMEHSISKKILERLSEFIKFVKKCPRMDIKWSQANGYFCGSMESKENCLECINNVIKKIKDKNI